MVEALKTRKREAIVQLNHVNPVGTFFVIGDNERCFVCLNEVRGEGGHPAFDIMLRYEEHRRVQGMFSWLGSKAYMHPTINRFCGPGGQISGCNLHRPNVEALREAVHTNKAIRTADIRMAMAVGREE